MGDLVACACALPTGAVCKDVVDSKKMTEKRRARVASELRATSMYGIGSVSAHEIDELGMGACRRLVFERALDDFVRRNDEVPHKVLVDGTLYTEWRGVPYECHVQGDSKFPCISAASILAKTERDARVLKLVALDPVLDVYGWTRNKGYPTAQHYAALRENGPTVHHRHSFRLA